MHRALMILIMVVSLGMTVLFQVIPAVYAEEASASYPFFRNPAMSDVDVLIDAGHGGVGSGTLHANIYEKDINLEMARRTYKLLRKKGHTVLVNRTDDYALSDENRWLRSRSRHLKDLAQRSHLANEIHPKVVISLHVNWSRNVNKRGPLVLFQTTGPSKQLAQTIQQSMNNLYGTATEAMPGKPYYLLKHVKVPAVIIEMGFISNPSDREQMMQPEKQEQLAEAITAGVIAYLNTVH